MSLVLLSAVWVGPRAMGADMKDLTLANNAEKLAPGIWRISIGDMEKELRYTDYAAAPPKMEVLNAKSNLAYPFKNTPISFYISPDNRIMVRIPADKSESLFGFGLQLRN